MRSPISDAFLKVEWAKQNIEQLNLVITTFARSEYFKITPKKDPQTGQNGLEVEVLRNLPKDVPLMMADVIHNLRSSLDIAISGIFRRETGTYSDWLGFPFRETRDDLVNAVNRGDIQKTPKAVRDYIVDGAKSYEAGNFALWSLHNLDNWEKHSLVVPVAGTGIVAIMSDGPNGEGNFSITGTFFNLNAGNTFLPMEGHSNFKVNQDFQPTLYVSIDPTGLARGQQIIPMLISFADCVSSILNDLERICTA